MSSARFITLFSEPPPSSRNSASIALSIVSHGAMLGVISLWLMRQVPQVNDPLRNQLLAHQDTVHLVNLDKPEPVLFRSGMHGLKYSTQQAVSPNQQAGAHTPPSGAKISNKQAIPMELAQQTATQQTAALQTIMQPELPPNVLLQNVPVPNVVLLTADAPPPQQVVPPPQLIAAAVVQPSLTVPNEEAMPADIKISSTDFSTPLPAPPPSTTTVVVQPPEPTTPVVALVPETTAKSTTPPTPANVISLSELHIPDAEITMSAANETAAADTSTALAPGQAPNSAGTASGSTAAADTAGSSTGNAASLNAANAGSSDRITLPKNGQFGVVVVGASLDEEYPEANQLWAGRMPLTVYLHVGLAKSWILQYSLPRAADAAAVGTLSHLDAPWPYDILRPNLSPGDINSDALMVHGFVNKDGHFETLAVVSPQQFPQEKFVLDALRQWQFRPAEQNGQDTDVEVLLIIPDELD
jgi:hypothetical protein